MDLYRLLALSLSLSLLVALSWWGQTAQNSLHLVVKSAQNSRLEVPKGHHVSLADVPRQSHSN